MNLVVRQDLKRDVALLSFIAVVCFSITAVYLPGPERYREIEFLIMIALIIPILMLDFFAYLLIISSLKNKHWIIVTLCAFVLAHLCSLIAGLIFALALNKIQLLYMDLNFYARHWDRVSALFTVSLLLSICYLAKINLFKTNHKKAP